MNTYKPRVVGSINGPFESTYLIRPRRQAFTAAHPVTVREHDELAKAAGLMRERHVGDLMTHQPVVLVKADGPVSRPAVP